jgi:hypothetical protein
MDRIYEHVVQVTSSVMDIHTEFYRDRFRHSKVVKGVTHTDTDTEQCDLISILLFF